MLYIGALQELCSKPRELLKKLGQNLKKESNYFFEVFWRFGTFFQKRFQENKKKESNYSSVKVFGGVDPFFKRGLQKFPYKLSFKKGSTKSPPTLRLQLPAEEACRGKDELGFYIRSDRALRRAVAYGGNTSDNVALADDRHSTADVI